MANMLPEIWVFVGGNYLGFIIRQDDIAAIIICMKDGFHIRTTAVGGCIYVAAETDNRKPLIGVGCDGCVNISVLVCVCIGEANSSQFLSKQIAQLLLLFSCGK